MKDILSIKQGFEESLMDFSARVDYLKTEYEMAEKISNQPPLFESEAFSALLTKMAIKGLKSIYRLKCSEQEMSYEDLRTYMRKSSNELFSFQNKSFRGSSYQSYPNTSFQRNRNSTFKRFDQRKRIFNNQNQSHAFKSFRSFDNNNRTRNDVSRYHPYQDSRNRYTNNSYSNGKNFQNLSNASSNNFNNQNARQGPSNINPYNQRNFSFNDHRENNNSKNFYDHEGRNRNQNSVSNYVVPNYRETQNASSSNDYKYKPSYMNELASIQRDMNQMSLQNPTTNDFRRKGKVPQNFQLKAIEEEQQKND
ncbi:CLUMA_CG002774, isoform A [Clunio marinus]|uniref:CLUMA_CG002774, isoform A n=1 Tax=Clunio marinus TaxID=568069 RepID=A0A1J1HLH6_9DIPT|nr:CLUMA_CG002774, isoform A [Clunio marinus]